MADFCKTCANKGSDKCSNCTLTACEGEAVSIPTYYVKKEICVKTEEKDMVNHPDHYTAGGIECIDGLAAATTGLEGIEAVCTANAIKYLWRWKHKNGIQDLDKAIWYINHLKEELVKKG